MNTPPTKFAIMRANREKQRQIAAYGRMLDSISRNAMGVQSQGPGLGFVYTNAGQQAAVHRLPPEWTDKKQEVL